MIVMCNIVFALLSHVGQMGIIFQCWFCDGVTGLFMWGAVKKLR